MFFNVFRAFNLKQKQKLLLLHLWFDLLLQQNIVLFKPSFILFDVFVASWDMLLQRMDHRRNSQNLMVYIFSYIYYHIFTYICLLYTASWLWSSGRTLVQDLRYLGDPVPNCASGALQRGWWIWTPDRWVIFLIDSLDIRRFELIFVKTFVHSLATKFCSTRDAK